MDGRVEMRLEGHWEQPLVVSHPDPSFCRKVCDVLARGFGVSVRLTTENNANPERWGEGTAVYETNG